MKLSVCGVDCEGCKHLGVECSGGCAAVQGRVYWLDYIGAKVCPIYACAAGKKYGDCGECADLPCKIWHTLKDPAMTEEAFQQSIRDRVEALGKKEE